MTLVWCFQHSLQQDDFTNVYFSSAFIAFDPCRRGKEDDVAEIAGGSIWLHSLENICTKCRSARSCASKGMSFVLRNILSSFSP